ncbi:MAG: class I SAM-dependent methyltransferase [Clostridiales bacterium]|nr:class I SAM-dependent methyltransferase [Clostridiales bacterium]
MASIHPGGEELTDRCVALAGFEAGMRILDVGCGDGTGMERLTRDFSLDMIGCDSSPAMIKAAKAKNSSLRIKKTDGVCLDFPSLSFDGVLLECSFSLMDRHEELLHELYCILKPGARFAMTDLYMLAPDPKRVSENKKAAREFLGRPRQENDCGSGEYPSPVLLDGMFVVDELARAIFDAGFDIVKFEDHTKELRDYAAQALMDYGSVEAMLAASLPEGADSSCCCRAKLGKNTGYFLLVAQKRKI